MNLRSPRTASARRRDEARALFRNGILEAAEQVFAERGVGAARIQDIARRARIAVGTVYNHFADKEDVLAVLIDERIDEMVACLARRAGDGRSFRQALVRRVERLLAYADRHRDFCALLLAHGLSDGRSLGPGRVLGARARRRVEKLRAAWMQVVDEGLAAGALARLERGYLAAVLGGLARAVILSGVFEEKPVLPELAELVVRLFLDGAGATRRVA